MTVSFIKGNPIEILAVTLADEIARDLVCHKRAGLLNQSNTQVMEIGAATMKLAGINDIRLIGFAVVLDQTITLGAIQFSRRKVLV